MERATMMFDSPPSLWLGFCAWAPPSLCRVSGAGFVLGFGRVFAESLAQLGCLGFAESTEPRFCNHDQVASRNHYQPHSFDVLL